MPIKEKSTIQVFETMAIKKQALPRSPRQPLPRPPEKSSWSKWKSNIYSWLCKFSPKIKNPNQICSESSRSCKFSPKIKMKIKYVLSPANSSKFSPKTVQHWPTATGLLHSASLSSSTLLESSATFTNTDDHKLQSDNSKCWSGKSEGLFTLESEPSLVWKWFLSPCETGCGAQEVVLLCKANLNQLLHLDFILDRNHPVKPEYQIWVEGGLIWQTNSLLPQILFMVSSSFVTPLHSGPTHYQYW